VTSSNGPTSQPVLRTAALLLGGAMALHQLRYRLAPGADDVLVEHGHGYLGATGPIVALACAMVFAVGLVKAAAGPVGVRPQLRLRALWPLASAALLALYGSQELLESAVAPGHAGIVEAGGWAALPLALGLGGTVALLICVGDAAERWSMRAVLEVVVRVAEPPAIPLRAPGARAPRAALAHHLAGRAPPAPRF